VSLWREEFSVHAAEEHYVARRQFGKFLVLTSLGMFAGNLWILAKSLLERREALPALPIGRVGDLPAPGAKVFRYPRENDACLLLRAADGAYRAFSQKCTHLSCAVIPTEDATRLDCPCHDGAFSGADGRVLQGPPPRPLPRILLEERGGELWAVGIDLGGGDR
jgi:nitrite reductase/ring-hydroxylating ferredoxin subunit